MLSAGIGIVISGSREALFAASAGMALLLFKTSYQNQPVQKLGKILLAGLFFLAAYQATSTFRARFENNVFHRMEAIVDAKDLAIDENFSARTKLAADTIRFYVSKPSFLVLGRGLPIFGGDNNWFILDSDSAFLNTINCVGVFGLGFIIWFYTRIWLLSMFLRENNPDAARWSTGVQAAIVTYCTLGLAANVFGSPHTTMVFLLTAFLPLMGMGALAVPMSLATRTTSHRAIPGYLDDSSSSHPAGDE